MRGSGATQKPSRAKAVAVSGAALLALAGGAGVLAGATPAQAALGRAAGSVEADRAHMAARRTLGAGNAHTVNTLTLPANGEGVVKEFARPDGTVFAVSWAGPGRPDLRQLLGDHFEAYQAQAASPARRRMRGPVGVANPDLVVHSAGRPGAFFGFAYLPNGVPDGFSMRELQ